MVDVYLNSKFIGVVDDPLLFIENVKDQRRKGTLHENVNVFFDETANEVYLRSDEGRSRRPLIIVKEGKSLLMEKHLNQLEDGEIVWSDLIRQGVIEYLDAAEEENALVAYEEEQLTPQHTHMEITKGSISGLATERVSGLALR